MRIFVCLKQVPDTETRIQIKSDKSGIEENGVKWVMNPYDEYAVEEALKIRDAKGGGQVTAVSVGPKARVSEALGEHVDAEARRHGRHVRAAIDGVRGVGAAGRGVGRGKGFGVDLDHRARRLFALGEVDRLRIGHSRKGECADGAEGDLRKPIHRALL